MKKYIVIFSLALFFPFISFAASPTLLSILQSSVTFQNALVVFAIGAGLTGFLFGVVKYITAGQDTEKMKNGRNLMIFGIIALFVMVSVWGLVKLLQDSFDVRGSPETPAPPAPTIPTGPNGSSNSLNSGAYPIQDLGGD